MNTYRITDPDDPKLAPLWDIYRHSFPEVEQRTLADHKAALKERDFHCRALMENGKVQGLLLFWDFEQVGSGLRYIEHFAFAPEARNDGHGSRVLSAFAKERPDLLLMLEIDPLETGIARRRLQFYERLGYVMNEPPYWHPPYQREHTDYPLLLCSLGRAMRPEERIDFERAVKDVAMRYAMDMGEKSWKNRIT